MTIHNDAADSIRRLARQYEQMVVAADLLDKFGSLETATKEAEVARAKAAKARDEAIAAYARTMDDLEAVRKQAKEIAAKAAATAESMVDAAKINAQGIVEAANTAAAQISNTAALKAAESEQAAVQRKHAIAADIAQAIAERASIIAESKDKLTELSAIEDKIAITKSKIAAMLA